MRVDFYRYNKKRVAERSQLDFLDRTKEMHDYMLLKGTSVADTFQGTVFKNVNIPASMDISLYQYNVKFCNAECANKLRAGCIVQGVLKNVKDWCLTALDWLGDIENLKGPPSYILKITVEVVLDSNARKDGLQGALVAAAATSAMLTSNWWEDGNIEFGDDFGFAVQHSLWLAIFAGRIRFTIHPKRWENYGTKILCNVEEAENFKSDTGSVYASLCVFLAHNKHMRVRPEIHTRNSIGCVEKTTGMAFIRVGDWVAPDGTAECIGDKLDNHGILFKDQKFGLTTAEITPQDVTLFPANFKKALKNIKSTKCTDEDGTQADGNGPNEDNILGQCGLQKIGGICNWFPVW